VQLSRLRFPPICSDCGAPTPNTLTWPPNTLITVNSDQLRVPRLPIPLCNACQTSFRRSRLKGILIGGLTGAIVLQLWLLTERGIARVQILFDGLFFLWLFGAIGYAFAARTVPIKVRRYSALDGTVEVRFRSAEYAERVIARIRAWENLIQQGKAH